MSFASPKSSTFAPCSVSMMLPGLRSRWTIPTSVGAIERATRSRWHSGSLGPLGGVPCLGGLPASHRRSTRGRGNRRRCSCRRHRACRCADDSMPRWHAPRPRTVLGTRGSFAMCAGRILIATVRLRRLSRARYTSPIPPAPMLATICTDLGELLGRASCLLASRQFCTV